LEKNNINIRQFAPKKQGPGYLFRFVIYAIVLGALLWLIYDRLNEVNNNPPKVLKKEHKSPPPQIEIE
jgi:hypothetical protein